MRKSLFTLSCLPIIAWLVVACSPGEQQGTAPVSPSSPAVSPSQDSSTSSPAPTSSAESSPASFPDNAASEGTNAVIIGDPSSKNIRSGPGTEYEVQQTAYPGDPVQILDSAQDSGGYTWYKVRFPQSGAQGWIAAQLVEVDGSTSSVEGAQAPDSGASEAPAISGGAKCSDFATQAEAQAALPNNPQLDRDKDGVACESLL